MASSIIFCFDAGRLSFLLLVIIVCDVGCLLSSDC